MDALSRAIEICGTQAELARRLGVKQQIVWSWVNRSHTVPAEYCRAVEDATGGEVTRYELRSDVFGPAPHADGTAVTTPTQAVG